MGERKVLNKYYPPDFDPAKIPRRKQPKNLQIKVRMMLPMSIRCSTCGTYISKGTKFNCRKEDVIGETYLGILIFRFYFKCSCCSAELVMKTDPQNSDYIMESGASRNFEPWRDKDVAVDEAAKKREKEEMGDSMKALENRTEDSKREMDILAALDEMKSMRSRQAGVNTDEMLQALRRTAGKTEEELAEEDEALIRSMVFRNSTAVVHRIMDDDDEDADDENVRHQGETAAGRDGLVSHLPAPERTRQVATLPKPLIIVKPKNKAGQDDTRSETATLGTKRKMPIDDSKQRIEHDAAKPLGLASLMSTYDSDD